MCPKQNLSRPVRDDQRNCAFPIREIPHPRIALFPLIPVLIPGDFNTPSIDLSSLARVISSSVLLTFDSILDRIINVKSLKGISFSFSSRYVFRDINRGEKIAKPSSVTLENR